MSQVRESSTLLFDIIAVSDARAVAPSTNPRFSIHLNPDQPNTCLDLCERSGCQPFAQIIERCSGRGHLFADTSDNSTNFGAKPYQTWAFLIFNAFGMLGSNCQRPRFVRILGLGDFQINTEARDMALAWFQGAGYPGAKLVTPLACQASSQ